MFHTPNLTGIRKSVVPKRINEGWGLQHMKLYGFDDELIMSGANLSQDYFTNRQDRYHVFKSKQLTDFFWKIHSSVCSLSFNILPSPEIAGYTISWPSSNPAPSPLDSPNDFRKGATAVLAPLLYSKPEKDLSASNETIVYPVLQFTPLLRPDTSTELPILTSILTQLASPALSGSSWTFTAGYFNMTPSFRRLLLATNPAQGTVIAASPWANGFYGSAGISGMLPAAYTHLSKRFLESVRRSGLADQIKLREWRRGTVNEPDGWTYHAKGIWLTLPNESKPSLSIVGSSNYTKRSYELDLEANVVIVTKDEKLKQKLAEEEGWLQEYAKQVDESEFSKAERHVSWKVRLAMWTVRVLGGAL
jgi:CDP-diacylglycerol--glycerol-3-phosphate 3-phosphatidyltransferase